MDQRDLHKLFNDYGIVTDAFIPNKRSRRGTRFSFVRYNCEVAAGMAVEKGNGLCIHDREIRVEIAAYGRVQVGQTKILKDAIGKDAVRKFGLEETFLGDTSRYTKESTGEQSRVQILCKCCKRNSVYRRQTNHN
ncbi:Serine arginine-rich splicing factor 2 [Dionaea muscipula]